MFELTNHYGIRYSRQQNEYIALFPKYLYLGLYATLHCLQGSRSHLQGVQASDKYHVFQPRFLTINHSNSFIFPKIHFGYIFAYKGVENKPNKQIGDSLTSKVMQYVFQSSLFCCTEDKVAVQ
ncbi:Hypothetical_protein [Hexamita inflata]|uniref:Hypothetical_protein n=1 Tax=Hexamita inflata TaxID=28002 RepID=A0AA86V033_9EUKA|nr:Hypothetical protein HINF_LOCUS58786 [Hexamita inflata]